jgi:hypothetical protein
MNSVLFVVPGLNVSPVYSSILSTSSGLQANGNPIVWTQSQIQPVPDQAGHPVLSISTYNWSRSPLVTVLSSGFNAKSGNLPLIFAPQYEEIPVISSQRIGNYRSTVVSFSGFQSFYVSGNDEDRSVFTDLMGNMITWSASDTDQDLLRISTNKADYSARESIVFNARISREDGSPEADAIVNIDVIDQESNSRSYSLQNTGNGNYSITLPGLPAGAYSYIGSATKNEFNIGESSGSFTVGNAQQELINTTRQDELLRQISNLTGGINSDYTQMNFLLNELTSSVQPSQVEQTEIFNLYKQPIWLLLAILLLTSEWLLRRKLLLP